MKRTPLKRGNKSLSTNKPLQSRSTLKSKKNALKTKKRINGKSGKQKQIESDYNKIKRDEFDENSLCTGCERTTESTPSHLIPRSRRPDLISEKRNIKPHCIVCHPKWESPQRVELLDYEENMQIVKELDPEYYELLLMKQQQYGKR